jgi:hypothetical protein
LADQQAQKPMLLFHQQMLVVIVLREAGLAGLQLVGVLFAKVKTVQYTLSAVVDPEASPLFEVQAITVPVPGLELALVAAQFALVPCIVESIRH